MASSPELASEFLKTNEVSFAARVDSLAVSRLTYGYSMAFAPFNSYWKFIRKLTMNDLLSSRNVNSFASLRSRELRRFLRLLAEKSERNEAANVSAELQKLSFSVIAQMVLGSDGTANAGMDRGRAEEARTVVREVTRIFGELNLSDFFWVLKRLDFQGYGKRIEDIFRRYDGLIEAILGEREELRRNRNKEEEKEGVVKCRNLMDILLDHLEDQKDNENVEFTRLHVKGLIMDIFTAGTDTTSSSIDWTLSELINNPTVLKKARDEIDRVVGKTRLVNESDASNLPYIQAMVKETLRLHPVVPVVSRKCIKECKIGKYIIPENAMLFINSWAMTRDPKYWENPLEFQPERFLQGHEGSNSTSSSIDVKGQHFELFPFGSGRRMCPGMNLALQTLPTFIAAIIQCFDFKVVGDGGDGHALSMEEGPGLASPRAHELLCVPVPRLSPLSAILEP